MLKVELIGNLGANAEIKDVNGKKFLTFRVAHTDRFTNAEGVVTENTMWVSCSMNFGLDKLSTYLTAGKKVYVSGTLDAKVYKGNDGAFHAGLTIFVREIELLSPKQNQ